MTHKMATPLIIAMMLGLVASATLASAGKLPPYGTLVDEVSTLKTQVDALQSANSTLQAQITALQSALAAVQANPALALGPYVTVDPNAEKGLAGPHVIFKGANVHIESGSDSTVDTTGLGNLVIGYDSDSSAQFCDTSAIDASRTGSHNLIVGDCNQFTNSGGLVAGFQNVITGPFASVSGGTSNTASGDHSSVSAGFNNTASGLDSSISGGDNGIASGQGSSIGGGGGNTASGYESAVSGGDSNTASEIGTSISGGQHNTASALLSSVSGGRYNTASGFGTSVSGGECNSAGVTASGLTCTPSELGQGASVSGGNANFASGQDSSVGGGIGQTASGADQFLPN